MCTKLHLPFVRVLDGLHSAFAVQSVYFYAVTNFMNPLELTKIHWYVATDPTMYCHLLDVHTAYL